MALFHTTVLDNQIKALPTVDTASGSIATFETDMTENLVEVKCQIVAQQSGSGTPSPDNVRPITTYSEMNVLACGKNLIDQTKYYQLNANILVIGQTVSNANRLVYLPQGTYTIKVETSNQATIYYDYGNGSTSLGNTSDKRTFTLENDSYCAFWLYKSGGYSPSDIITIQLEQGNEATTYEPYNGTNANIPFGQTVAGGVLDVTTGVLRVTHEIKDLGTINYNFSADDTVKQDFNSAGIQTEIKGVASTDIADIACTELQATSRDIQANNPTSVFYSIAVQPSGVIRIITPPSTYATTGDFKTAMSGVMLVFEYITPKTIQLDSKQITALLNENNIWCDTGDTEVKYLLSVGKKIS